MSNRQSGREDHNFVVVQIEFNYLSIVMKQSLNSSLVLYLNTVIKDELPQVKHRSIMYLLSDKNLITNHHACPILGEDDHLPLQHLSPDH